MFIKVQQNEIGQRFDRFLRKYFKKNLNIKLADIYTWIRQGNIKVNGKKQSENYKLEFDDLILFDENIEQKIKKNEFSKNEKKINVDINKIKKQIIFEDENWIFWDKPSKLVVHPGTKHIEDLTLNDYLEIYCKYLEKKQNIKIFTKTFKPSFGFRLDADTSGIIIGAKNYDALKYLNELIRKKQVDKTYIAIVKGIFPKQRKIDLPLFRGFNKKFGRAQSFVNEDKGEQAISIAKLLKSKKDEYLGDISLVQVNILTGRMHQIRSHLSYIGFPILGDIMYGNHKINKILEKKYKITRQLLHSIEYGFFDKFKNKYIKKTAPIPVDFKKVINNI